RRISGLWRSLWVPLCSRLLLRPRLCLRARLFLWTGPSAAGLRRQLIRSVWYAGPWSQLLFRPTAISTSAAELRFQSTAVSAAAAVLRSQSASTVQSITVSQHATHVLASD